MNPNQSVQQYNRATWDRIAQQGDKYFPALTEQEIELAKTGKIKIKVTPIQWVPEDWLGDVCDKTVLCLACGGGQQAPLFAAAGADTTVFDFSEQQLHRDQQANKNFDLEIKIAHGDMADLSIFQHDRFDLIINPCSVCYCPDLNPIWNEVARVLKPGGRFITGFTKPVNYLFDPIAMEEKNILAANRKIPYSDLHLEKIEREQIMGGERPIEFGHSLADLIGGQIAAGLRIIGFYEDRWGGDDLLSEHIDVFAATLATK